MRLIVGTAPGGGYDLFARIVARHIAAHIPGQPTVIVQNLPAAGGLVMTNQLYALGPKDGTAIGVPINGIPTAPLLQQGAQFDADQADLDRQHQPRALCRLRVAHRAGAEPRRAAEPRSWSSARPRRAPPWSDFPLVVNDILGLKFKMVRG